MKTEVRTATDSHVSALCMECLTIVTGRVSVQFIETCDGRGVQVFVSTGTELHPIARFKCDLIPVVPFELAGTVPSA